MESTAVAGDPQSYLTLASRHYENFPVGSFLLPKPERAHLHAIYAFARTADDLADELRDAGALGAFRAAFLDHLAGVRADVPMLESLARTIRERNLETELFTDLLSAFEQDLAVRRYDREGLMDYCRRSANPIGRLVLRVFGLRDRRLDSLSDRICTALQLLNHLQDMRSDLIERDRIYFPAEDLARFSVQEVDLRAARANAAVRAFAMHWARQLGREFAAGWEIVGAVTGRLRWELRAVIHGAARVLRRIESEEGDVLGGRVRLSRAERLMALLRGCLRKRPPRWPKGAA